MMYLFWMWFGVICGWLVCALMAHSARERECSECTWRNRVPQHPVSMDDLCIACGAEGFDPPRHPVGCACVKCEEDQMRREVAEQLGCEEAAS